MDQDKERHLPANGSQQPDKAKSRANSNSSNSPNNPTELVPIFFENDYLRAFDRGNLSRFITAYDPAAPPPDRPFPFQFPLPQIARITMADRFPSIGDLNLGECGSEVVRAGLTLS